MESRTACQDQVNEARSFLLKLEFSKLIQDHQLVNKCPVKNKKSSRSFTSSRSFVSPKYLAILRSFT